MKVEKYKTTQLIIFIIYLRTIYFKRSCMQEIYFN